MTLPHEIHVVTGKTGSGKTALIAHHIGPRHARRVTLDFTGECRKLYPHAVEAVGVLRVIDTLRAWDNKNVQRWHLVAALEVPEVATLVDLFAPKYDGKRRGLAELYGGVALECFELDLIMPVDRSTGETGHAMRHAFARGRHYGLSILAATQRPRMIDRMATAQSSALVTFTMHEPDDIKFLERAGGRAFAELARRLPRFHSAWYWPESGRVATMDDRYRWLAGEHLRNAAASASDKHTP